VKLVATHSKPTFQVYCNSPFTIYQKTLPCRIGIERYSPKRLAAHRPEDGNGKEWEEFEQDLTADLNKPIK
jgi:hypothetical protein